MTQCTGISVGECGLNQKKFPLDKDPINWHACDDSYLYKWSLYLSNAPFYVSNEDALKLSRSMGFCPQSRCQLSNISSSSFAGKCPTGLCYTKVKNGRPSTGAFCYSEGIFDSGQLLGYYNKTQPSPKPVYITNRIVLGNLNTDSSYGSFISANEVHPNIILNQCPLAGRPSEFVNTVNDVKRMILEQNISMWIQLAPTSPNGLTPSRSAEDTCSLFPVEFFDDPLSPYSTGISGFRTTRDPSLPYVIYYYDVTGYVRVSDSGEVITLFRVPDEPSVASATTSEEEVSAGLDTETGTEMGMEVRKGARRRFLSVQTTAMATVSSSWTKVTMSVEHYWYYNWEDFQPPPDGDTQALLNIADKAVAVLRSRDGKSKVAINCLSGRGRSGTMAALILGRSRGMGSGTGSKSSSLSMLVDDIVAMRESRDSVVETPEQFVWLTRTLQLQENRRSSSSPSSSHSISISPILENVLCFLAGIVLSCIVFIIWKKQSSKASRTQNSQEESSHLLSTALKAS
eukprot:gene1340-2589_t